MARRQLVGKNLPPRSPLYPLARSLSLFLSRYFFLPPSCIRPPAVLPLQYLRVCRSSSDFHLSRFASSTIRDISVHVLYFTLEYIDALQRDARRYDMLQSKRKLHFCNLLRLTAFYRFAIDKYRK